MRIAVVHHGRVQYVRVRSRKEIAADVEACARLDAQRREPLERAAQERRDAVRDALIDEFGLEAVEAVEAYERKRGRRP